MGGYTKNVAVIKGISAGFSADGGALSGLVRAERYSGELTVEVTLINFAPTTQGRYVCAVGDGKNCQILENNYFSGPSPVDTSGGFCAAVCFVNNGVRPVASAVCGNCGGAFEGLVKYIIKSENIKEPPAENNPPEIRPEKYEDEAVAEENYYEYAETDEGRGAVRQGEEKKEDGQKSAVDEKAVCAGKEGEDALAPAAFYYKMKDEIENIFLSYPPAEELNAAIENSRWAKIEYGGGKCYVFGVISQNGMPQYLCYGLPAKDTACPPGLRGISSYLPVKTQYGMGFWVIYQSAETGLTATDAAQ